MAKFETLERDIKEMLRGAYSLEELSFRTDTAHNVLKLAKNIATHTLQMVDHKAPVAKDPSNHTIRMSEIGEPCMRKLMYKWYLPEKGMHPYAEMPEAYLPVKFTFGDYIEELTLFLAAEAGHDVTDRQAEYQIKVHGCWTAVGHIDAKIDGVVVDVKSAADGSFSKYKREGLTDLNDSFGYRWQIDSYAFANSSDERAFLFMNKHDGELMVINRSKEVMLPIEERIGHITGTAELVMRHAHYPDRLPTNSTKYGSELKTVCSYCAFKYNCYNGNVKGVIVSGRPKYFVESELTKEGYDYIKDKAQIAKPKAFA